MKKLWCNVVSVVKQTTKESPRPLCDSPPQKALEMRARNQLPTINMTHMCLVSHMLFTKMWFTSSCACVNKAHRRKWGTSWIFCRLLMEVFGIIHANYTYRSCDICWSRYWLNKMNKNSVRRSRPRATLICTEIYALLQLANDLWCQISRLIGKIYFKLQRTLSTCFAEERKSSTFLA